MLLYYFFNLFIYLPIINEKKSQNSVRSQSFGSCWIYVHELFLFKMKSYELFFQRVEVILN